MGAPACAGMSTPPTRARGFFGTDTLPPSAQTIQSPRPLAQSLELKGPPPGPSFVFLFPFLGPGPRRVLRVLAFSGASRMEKGDTGLGSQSCGGMLPAGNK